MSKNKVELTKSQAVAEALAAEADAKNAAHAAAHKMETIKEMEDLGPYGSATARAAKLQELAMADRMAPVEVVDPVAAQVEADAASAAVNDMLAAE